MRFALMISLAAVIGEPVVSPSFFAAGISDFRAAMRRADGAIENADAIGTAVKRLQNRFAELPVGAAGPSCGDSFALSLAFRSKIFGEAYRGAVQDVRVQSARLHRLVEAPTLVAVLSVSDRGAADRTLIQAKLHSLEYLEASAWHLRYLAPFLLRCAPVEDAIAPGLPEPLGLGAGLEKTARAVIGIGGGKICPGAFPANGTVVVLQSDRACYGPTCECETVPVDPGAVFGPLSP